MTNNTTADTSASGAGEAFVEAWLVGNDESGPYVLRRKSTGWLYEVPLVRKSAHDTLRAQLEAAEAEAVRMRPALALCLKELRAMRVACGAGVMTDVAIFSAEAALDARTKAATP